MVERAGSGWAVGGILHQTCPKLSSWRSEQQVRVGGTEAALDWELPGPEPCPEGAEGEHPGCRSPGKE